jgi:glycosyltransferase involved in cell wall biosynthesis
LNSKISIITVNYNNLEGLKKTVKSVKNQTYKAFEYIVIDGGSKDGSFDYLNVNSKYFNYWVSEPDKGVYHAMNKGIEKASGEYLLFLNSGDHFYNAEVLEKQHQYLNSSDIIYFDLQVIEDEKIFIKTYPDILSFSYFVEDTLPHPATFIKKQAFLKTNLYKEDFKIVSDWKFFIDAICKYNLSYKRIGKTLSTFYIGGISSNPENQIVKYNEKEAVLTGDYALYTQDINDVVSYRKTLNNLRGSRIIQLLIKLGFLNKF